MGLPAVQYPIFGRISARLLQLSPDSSHHILTSRMPLPADNQELMPSSGKQRGASHPSAESASAEEMDLTQVYALIDSILPFEACLYYQVLPLMIEGSRLVIGMVNPSDHTASEYVKRQLAFINYSISTREIASDWNRDLLSKYLSHHSKARQQSQTRQEASPPPSRGTAQAAAVPKDEDAIAQATFIVDQPEELEEMRAARQGRPAPAPETAKPVRPKVAARSPQPPPPESSQTPSPSAGYPPLHLQVDERYKGADATVLAGLQPKELMQGLLSKVLDEGIGRLYFERRPDTGRILWSKDGVLQAVMDTVDPMVFQGVINELKLLTHLSLIPVRKARQVEIERLYQQTRILLRFRVMPGSNGEEATLQVLRGTALRFYQQQQIDKLGRDALDAAQILERRLNDIRDRARQTLNFNTTRSETLPAIIQMLKRMENQVQELISVYEAEQASQERKDPQDV